MSDYDEDEFDNYDDDFEVGLFCTKSCASIQLSLTDPFEARWIF